VPPPAGVATTRSNTGSVRAITNQGRLSRCPQPFVHHRARIEFRAAEPGAGQELIAGVDRSAFVYRSSSVPEVDHHPAQPAGRGPGQHLDRLAWLRHHAPWLVPARLVLARLVFAAFAEEFTESVTASSRSGPRSSATIIFVPSQ